MALWTYFDYPLEQGLRPPLTSGQVPARGVFWLSIRTRIKTNRLALSVATYNVYFDYPLEQGLRQNEPKVWALALTYFDYPLEQGLRRSAVCPHMPSVTYFDYPLEQGLRQSARCFPTLLFWVFWLSIRTRIKTMCNNASKLTFCRYFDYPLEQGLRHTIPSSHQTAICILIIH